MASKHKSWYFLVQCHNLAIVKQFELVAFICPILCYLVGMENIYPDFATHALDAPRALRFLKECHLRIRDCFNPECNRSLDFVHGEHRTAVGAVSMLFAAGVIGTGTHRDWLNFFASEASRPWNAVQLTDCLVEPMTDAEEHAAYVSSEDRWLNEMRGDD